MNLKPFDLQAAMAGKPVVTRNGRPVVFGAFNSDAVASSQLMCWTGGIGRTYFASGIFDTIRETDHDLFMAPDKIVRWANVHKDRDLAYLYRSEQEAQRIRNTDVCIACIRIEFEEGEGL